MSIQKSYPEIASSMTTFVAAQTVLNKQHKTISHLYHEGMLDKQEAEKMLGAVETQMKHLIFDPPLLDMPDKITLLKQVEWMQNIDDQKMERVVERFEDLLMPRNCFVVRQGELDTNVYVLARGTVKVLRKNDDGSEFTLTELGIGSFFGEISWALNQPRIASVKTTSSCVLFKISGSDLENMV
ncbi:unnamed protein product, partial [Discosporangium mesarthrocarpum]